MMRVRFMGGVAGAVALVTVGWFLASAANGAVAQETTTTVPPGAVQIGDGFAFTGAVITSPAQPAPRMLDGYHTAVFVQSWFGDAFFGHPLIQDPPPDLPVYRVDVTGTWGSPESRQTVYYASDGTTAWLSYPQEQPVSMTPPAPPPPSNWFVAPPRVIAAFNGTATLEPTVGVQEAALPSTTVAPGEAPAASSGSSGSAIWWALAAGAVVVVVAAVLISRRRGRRPAADDLVSQDA